MQLTSVASSHCYQQYKVTVRHIPFHYVLLLCPTSVENRGKLSYMAADNQTLI